jgi:hypothetical protein
MACSDESACCSAAFGAPIDPRWRRALWIALVINAGFFVAEIVAGAAAGSTALQADALDFRGCRQLRHQPGRCRNGARLARPRGYS